MSKRITKYYQNLRGVDFSSDETLVESYRSPYAVNVYKNYSSALGQAVETRPGLKILGETEEEILGIFKTSFENELILKTISALWFFDGKDFSKICDGLKPVKGSLCCYYENFYFFCQGTYIKLTRKVEKNQETNLETVSYVYENVEDNAFVPTTYLVSRDGTSQEFQPFNLLTGKHKNHFFGNGTLKKFKLRPKFPTKPVEILEVKVDGATQSASAFSLSENELTFLLTPKDLATIEVLISEENEDNPLTNGRHMCYFDSRFFFSCRNRFFWSGLSDPSYVPDNNYEVAGTQEITSFLPIGHELAILSKTEIHVATPKITNNYTMPKVYDVTSISSNFGGREGFNFLDEGVFLSEMGITEISKLNQFSSRNLSSKSSLINGKLDELDLLSSGQLDSFKGYLVYLSKGMMFLGDSRQRVRIEGTTGAQYEWFFFDDIGTYVDGKFDEGQVLCQSLGKCFIGTKGGRLLTFKDDYSDTEIKNGKFVERPIFSCWTTPSTDFGARNLLKTCVKKGNLADLKAFPHSVVKLKAKGNLTPFKDIKRHSGGFFDFSNLDFGDFTFSTDEKSIMYFSPAVKKFERMSLMFYSDEIHRPFGIYQIVLEVDVLSYVKERA